ncbi:cell division protein ZipA [Shewanella gelidii]|uniref:Cell division protein ZipA n=1 Tax=Shewanella gelidii TaxID=1642821 RepID=A0A917NCP0_9GAMM|nr:cell division protein ZipA [Shewanella gelidii]MCL1098355.1 cell division protein ZipA [Shewanella gelidii]GGI84599.1 cell division protein ZipA [Shewanella gelidii]
MEDLQLVLSVLGAIAIVAVTVHGFWSIKKERQSRESYKDDSPLQSLGSAGRDRDGFDEYGVGDVVVKSATDAGSTDSIISTSEASSEAPVDVSLTNSRFIKPQSTKAVNEVIAVNSESIEKDVADELFELSEAPSQTKRKEPVMNSAKTPEPEIEQIQLDLGDMFSEEIAEEVEVDLRNGVEEKQNQAIEEQLKEEQEAEEQLGDPVDVLVLHLVAKEGEVLDGAELLQCLLTLNFKFGDMNIFHRHQDNAGTGKVIFSLANMVKPGIFDPDNMEQFTTPGVVLFLTLPCYGDALMNFSNMLNSVQQLADDLGARVLDGERQAWSEQTKLTYVQRIKTQQM